MVSVHPIKEYGGRYHLCRYAVSARMWRQVAVSAFLRYETYDIDSFAGVPAVVRQQPLELPDMEDAVLDSVLSLYGHRTAQKVRLLCVQIARGSAAGLVKRTCIPLPVHRQVGSMAFCYHGS